MPKSQRSKIVALGKNRKAAVKFKAAAKPNAAIKPSAAIKSSAAIKPSAAVNSKPAFKPDPAAKPSKMKYKVVVEPVLQQKKPLQSLHTRSTEPPSEYTHVPLGDLHFTELCKELSRKHDLAIYIVSTARNGTSEFLTDSISHHVNRVGYHFSSEVVRQAMKSRRNDKANHRNGHVPSARSELPRQTSDADVIITDPPTNSVESQYIPRELDLRIRDTILELFPQIPGRAMEAVVRRAFAKGADTVGNAKDLSLAKRVQLAVVAHIRHTLTPYDNLLKITGSKPESRRLVEQTNIEHVLKWRGEDVSGHEKAEVEKYFREVIVVDDDDEDDEHLEHLTASKGQRPAPRIFTHGGAQGAARNARGMGNKPGQLTTKDLHLTPDTGRRPPMQMHATVKPPYGGVKVQRAAYSYYRSQNPLSHAKSNTSSGLADMNEVDPQIFKPGDNNEKSTGANSIGHVLHTHSKERLGDSSGFQIGYEDGQGLSYQDPIEISSAHTASPPPQQVKMQKSAVIDQPDRERYNQLKLDRSIGDEVAERRSIQRHTESWNIEPSNGPTKYHGEASFTNHSRVQGRAETSHDGFDRRITPYPDESRICSREYRPIYRVDTSSHGRTGHIDTFHDEDSG